MKIFLYGAKKGFYEGRARMLYEDPEERSATTIATLLKTLSDGKRFW